MTSASTFASCNFSRFSASHAGPFPSYPGQCPVEGLPFHFEESGNFLTAFALIDQLSGVFDLLRR